MLDIQVPLLLVWVRPDTVWLFASREWDVISQNVMRSETLVSFCQTECISSDTFTCVVSTCQIKYISKDTFVSPNTVYHIDCNVLGSSHYLPSSLCLCICICIVFVFLYLCIVKYRQGGSKASTPSPALHNSWPQVLFFRLVTRQQGWWRLLNLWIIWKMMKETVKHAATIVTC